MGRTVKVALGKFACNGIEASLGADVAAGVQTALADYVRRIESGAAPVGIPPFIPSSSEPPVATSLDLSLDERTWATLRREADRQGTTPSQLAAHSVLIYLAELDRLTPPDGTTA
jgi:hypothetical protein